MNSMCISRARRRSAGLSRRVMQPVRNPAVRAIVSPWPSWASKVLISSAVPSACESRVTSPLVNVPSTSISSTWMRCARFAAEGGTFLVKLGTFFSIPLGDSERTRCVSRSRMAKKPNSAHFGWGSASRFSWALHKVEGIPIEERHPKYWFFFRSSLLEKTHFPELFSPRQGLCLRDTPDLCERRWRLLRLLTLQFIEEGF